MTNDRAEKEGYKSNVIHLLLLWTGFLSGACIASFLLDLSGNWTLIFPAALLLIGAILMEIWSIKI
jgi:uncharacterized membrane protein YoaK (UPF0700 family)